MRRIGNPVGANPAVLVRDPKLSLADGAIAIWPDLKQPLFQRMLFALAAHANLRTDVPFDQLANRERRIVMHGTGEDWIEVPSRVQAGSFKFQYKGLYPALEEAARLSPTMRGQLDHLVDEVECAVCGGSRLNELAAAVRLRDRTIGELCRLPLEKLLEEFKAWQPIGSEKKVAGELLREIRNRLEFLIDVGLEYLTLSRAAPTLSGGECSAFAWPVRSAADFVGCCTCSMSQRLDCIRTTIDDCRRVAEITRPRKYIACRRAR